MEVTTGILIVQLLTIAAVIAIGVFVRRRLEPSVLATRRLMDQMFMMQLKGRVLEENPPALPQAEPVVAAPAEPAKSRRLSDLIASEEAIPINAGGTE